jgi:acyl-CoA synthetase (AMP-forming)/AMP-acid ligase II
MATLYLKSTFPLIDNLPEISLWDFIFSRSIPSDQIIYVDESNGETLRYRIPLAPFTALWLNFYYCSFGQLKTLTKRLAYALRYRFGIDLSSESYAKDSPTIVLFAGNSIYYAATLLAIHAAGFCASPANAAFGKSDLVYQIRDSCAAAVISGSDLLDVASAACQEAGIDNLFVLDKQSPEAHPSIWSVIDTTEFTPEPLSAEESRTKTTLLCYSSGTSGRPKV